MNNKSNKILLISLLPCLLTFIFIVYILFPSIGKYSETIQKIKEKTLAYTETQKQINKLNENKALFNKIQKLKNDLATFDIEIPSESDLAVLLVDLERFAQKNKVKITNFSTKNEKEIDIVLPEKNKTKKHKKKKRKKDQSPVKLSTIPIEITILGYYKDNLNFINSLEKYQRKIIINEITASNFKEDEKNANPRVEMSINFDIYKMEIPEINIETQADNNADDEVKS